MKKVLIVDDDFLVRTYLKQIISWEEHGFYIIGDAKNGAEALEILQRDGTDILIADVSMPIMDGIELTRCVKNFSPRTHILILSCHDDFIYVKEAMKLGIDDYILKNDLSEETLLDALNKISFAEEENNSDIERLALIGRKKLQEDFFQAFDAGNTIENLDKLARDAELNTNFQEVAAFMIIPENWRQREQSLTTSERENFLSAFSEMILNAYKNFADVDRFQPLIFTSEHDGFFHWGLILENFSATHELSEQLQSFAKLYFNLELKIFLTSPEQSLAELSEQWQKIYALLKESAEQLREDLHPSIRLALKYIEAHYREEISQAAVAEAVHLNTSYFSTLFKKSLGKGFSDYLTELRIERVKERLLSGTEKIINIVMSEGFNDYQYFVKIFKKLTGFTPREYRQKFLS